MTLWSGSSKSLNGIGAIGIVSTNTGESIFVDTYYEVNPAILNENFTFTTSIKQGELISFSLNLSTVYPLLAKKLKLTFGNSNPSIPTLSIDTSYEKKLMVGMKNTYNLDSITIQAGVIEISFSVQNGKSINDFLTITRDGFSCAKDS